MARLRFGDLPTGTVLKDSLVLDEEKVEELDGHAGANACDEVGQSQEKWHVLTSEAFAGWMCSDAYLED